MKKIINITIEVNSDKLIGKKYVPRDNSYIKNLRDRSWASLYGSPNLRIISDTYSEKTGEFPNPDKYQTFINVIDILSGEMYRVMYSPAWVED